MAVIEVRVPDLGNFKDVGVIELLVKPGDAIDVDTPIATLETEKATMDVPSSAAGVIESLHIAVGGKVNSGDLVATLQVAAGAAAAPAKPAAPAAAPPAAPVAAPPPAVAAPAPVAPPAALAQAIPGARRDLAPISEAGFSRAHAGPSVRRLARELGVDLAQVAGSGPKARITHEDVKAWVKRVLQGGLAVAAAPALTKVPTVDFAAFGAVDVQPLSRVRKISGPRLHAAWVNIPHVTQHDEADNAPARKRARTHAPDVICLESSSGDDVDEVDDCTDDDDDVWSFIAKQIHALQNCICAAREPALAKTLLRRNRSNI
jgi:pyruvate dehydrogenase E2 component (dihydrolipoamide acetyltransferase)